ncbi:tetratricopeptide repeat protein [Planctomycetota bacterium]
MALSHSTICFLKALEGRRLKLGDTHPHTLESWNNLIDLYEAWSKPDKAKEWRAKSPAGGSYILS